MLISDPILLQAQPSPTTGKFSFLPNGNDRSSTLTSEVLDKNKDNFFEDIGASSFAFKPIVESNPSFFLGATNRVSKPLEDLILKC